MFIYIICPVTKVKPEQKQEIDEYVKQLESEGHTVHYPPRDVNQNDPTGWNICVAHREAMRKADRVDVFWDTTSSGSRFDLGMAFAYEKPIKLVKLYQPDISGKSYVKVMKIAESLYKKGGKNGSQ